jgi:hypothetical protein
VPAPYTSISYTLWDAADTFTLDPFTTSPVCDDATFTYTVADSGGNAIASPWSWTASTRVLDLGGLDVDEVGTHDWIVTGKLD